MVRAEVATLFAVSRKNLRKLILAAPLFFAAANPAAAADDPFLAKLVGEWTGRGRMLQTPDGEPERLFCKVTNMLAEGGASLVQRGRCSLASNSGAIDGIITAAGDGTYRGTLESLASKGPAQLGGGIAAMVKDSEGRFIAAEKGTKAEDRIDALQMNAKYVDRLTDTEVQSVNTIVVEADGSYTLLTTRVNPATGETYTSSRIAFTRN